MAQHPASPNHKLVAKPVLSKFPAFKEKHTSWSSLKWVSDIIASIKDRDISFSTALRHRDHTQKTTNNSSVAFYACSTLGTLQGKWWRLCPWFYWNKTSHLLTSSQFSPSSQDSWLVWVCVVLSSVKVSSSRSPWGTDKIWQGCPWLSEEDRQIPPALASHKCKHKTGSFS